MREWSIGTCHCGKRFIRTWSDLCRKCRPVDFTKAQQRREWHKHYIKRRNKDIQAYRKMQRERARRYYKIAAIPRRVKGREYARLYQHKIREEMLKAYGEKCTCCGETNRGFLTLDHVNNNGKLHRLAFKSGTLLDLRRRGWPKDGYTILCYNCNLGRARNKHICPHVSVIRLAA